MKTSQNKIIKIIGCLALGLLLASCSPKESKRKRNYSDDMVLQTHSTIKSIPNPQVKQQAIQLEKLLGTTESIVVDQIHIHIEDEKVDANLLMEKVITPLRDIILNIDYLFVEENRYIKTQSGRYIMPRLVNLFNDAILLVNKSKPILIEGSNLIEKYKEVLFWDCDQNLRGSCEFIKFFRSHDSVNMSRIAKMIHDREVDNNEKLRIIKAGFELKNRQLDSSLRFMLLERISASLSQENDGKMSSLRRRQDADLFANTLKIDSHNLNDDEKYIALIKSLNPWLLSRNVDDIKNPAMANIINLASKHLLYNKDGSLSDEIKYNVIPSLLHIVRKNYEQGFDFQQSNIKGKFRERYKDYIESKAQSPSQLENYVLTSVEKIVFPQLDQVLDTHLYGPESKDILNTLLGRVSSQGKPDEYFYLTHQSFYGHFNLEDATIFWLNTNKDVRRLMVEIEKIIKYQVVNNIVLTNNLMNDFYNRNENMSIIDLLIESENEASKISKVWIKMIDRSKSLKNLLTRVINQNRLSGEDKVRYDRISSNIEVLTKNIKFLVTYPNMFPLMHIMASLEMTDTIRTFFGGSRTIVSNDIIRLFFAGKIKPWFNFGNDKDYMDPREIIYTYYYALVSQIFETYSTNTIVNFSHEKFFKTVIKKLILPDEKELESKRTALLTIIETFRNNAKGMQEICEEEKNLQAQEAKDLARLKDSFDENDLSWYEAMRKHKVMRPRRKIKSQLAFVNLDAELYEGVSTRKDSIGSYITKIYSSGIDTTLKEMRETFPQKKILAGTILDIFKNFKGKDQPGIDEIVKEQFQRYYDLQTDYIKLYTEAESKVRSCDRLFLNRARDIRHMMIYREAEELSHLFDKVWEVLSPLTDSQRQALHSESPKIIEIEKIRKEFGRYTQNNNHPEGSRPQFPASYQDRFGYNQILTSQIVSYKMDTATRVYAYLNELFPDQYVITMPPDFKNKRMYHESTPDIIYFDWSIKDKETAKKIFIKSGVQAFANQMNWPGKATSISATLNKGDILVRLFKLGILTKDPEIDCNDKDLNESVRSKNCIKVTPKDLISHFQSTIDYMNIDERDKKILLLLSKESKYEQKLYESLIKKKDEHDLYSIYDLTFKRVFSDLPVSSTEEAWFSSHLVSYVESVHDMKSSNFIFPVPEHINEIFIKKYSQLLKDYYQSTRDFLLEIKKQTKHAEPMNYSYRIDQIHPLNVETNRWSQHQRINLEPLVSDLIFNKFEGLSQKLNNNTSGYFLDILDTYRNEIADIVEEE